MLARLDGVAVCCRPPFFVFGFALTSARAAIVVGRARLEPFGVEP